MKIRCVRTLQTVVRPKLRTEAVAHLVIQQLQRRLFQKVPVLRKADDHHAVPAFE